MSVKYRYLLVVILFCVCLYSQSWAGTTYTADTCSAADVNTKLGLATSGDTVQVPGPCSATWAVTVGIPEGVILKCIGGTCTITINSQITVNANDVRITGFSFVLGSAGYIIQIDALRGLIDNNSFTTTGGGELIFVYGPDSTWDEDSKMGTANNVFIENNTFTNSGGTGSTQCVDANHASVVVFRYNTITNAKFDGHGLYSNGPYPKPDSRNHSVRHVEVYNNSFDVSAWASIELRGGTGAVYNNTFVNNTEPVIYLREYCTNYSDPGSNCPLNNGASNYCCPDVYPCKGQIGRGKITGGVEALEPVYLWNNVVLPNYYVVGYDDTPGTSAAQIVPNGFPSDGAETACEGGPTVGFDNALGTWSDCTDIIDQGRDYYIDNTKSWGSGWITSYSAYTCPHPLATEYSGYTCDTATAGTGGYPGTLSGSTPTASGITIQGVQIQ